jgi:AcrR family transcriptional regulator
MPKLYPGYRDEIRKKIVNEAFLVFLAKGFEKTTMDDIAARLGVTKPAIYRYYKNKEELFLASMAETMMEEFKHAFATSFSSDDLVTGAGLFFDELLRIDRKYSAISKEMNSIIIRNAALQEGVDGLHSEGLAFMRQFFEQQKRKGTIHTTIEDIDLVLICSALAHGLSDSVSQGMDPDEAKRLWLLGFAGLVNVRAGKKSS